MGVVVWPTWSRLGTDGRQYATTYLCRLVVKWKLLSGNIYYHVVTSSFRSDSENEKRRTRERKRSLPVLGGLSVSVSRCHSFSSTSFSLSAGPSSRSGCGLGWPRQFWLSRQEDNEPFSACRYLVYKSNRLGLVRVWCKTDLCANCNPPSFYVQWPTTRPTYKRWTKTLKADSTQRSNGDYKNGPDTINPS